MHTPSLRKTRKAVILVTAAACLVYLVYRTFFTLNLASPYAVFASVLLLVGETFSILSIWLYFVQVWEPSEPPPMPILPGRTVDVFVPTLNEDVSLLRATLEACRRITYPHKTYLCDDGGTEQRLHDPEKGPAALVRASQLRTLCQELGAIYLTRPRNEHAKAGNLNSAFAQSDGEFIVIFDADHVPEPHFVTRLIGYFADASLAYVQTPHAFYNFNNFQSGFDAAKSRYVDEGELFYQIIQPGRNRWDCAIFAGSAAMFRRAALEDVGYIATETITEDLHTGLRLNARGWKSLAIRERMVAGQAAPDVTTFHTQRLRWGEGNLSIMAHDFPLTARGLTWPQRLCYFGSMMHWAGGPFKIAIYLTPILMLVTAVPPVSHFSWTLLLITLSYLAINLAALRIIGEGHVSIWRAELYCMINFWTQVRGTLRAIFRRRFQSFVVTSKRGRQSKNVWPYVRPQALLVLLSVLALVLGWYRLVSGVSDDWFRPIVPSFWVVFHLSLALVVIRRALSPEDRRSSYRHLVNLPVAYDVLPREEALARGYVKPAKGADDATSAADVAGSAATRIPGFGMTAELSEGGMTLVTYRPLPVGGVMRMALWGRGEQVRLVGEILSTRHRANRAEDVRGYQYGVRFLRVRSSQIDGINRICLQFAVPRLYAYFGERRRTLLEGLARWIRRRFWPTQEVEVFKYRLPVMLSPEGPSAPRVQTVTEDVSVKQAHVLLDPATAQNHQLSFLFTTPSGDLAGVAALRSLEVREFSGREYHYCALEYERFERDGLDTLQRLCTREEQRKQGAVLTPAPQKLQIPIARPLARGTLVALPLIAISIAIFHVVFLDDLFLRKIVTSATAPTQEETARVERLYNQTMAETYPGNDRLVLLMSALSKVEDVGGLDAVTKVLAVRDPSNFGLQVALAQAYTNTQKYAEAEAEYQRLLAESKKRRLPPAEQKALLVAAARSNVHAGQLGEGVERFQTALALDPSDRATRNEFAGVLLTANRPAEVISLYRDERPDVTGRLLLSSAYAMANDYERAESEARKALRDAPDDPRAERLLADVLSAKKGYVQAGEIYERLAKENPTDPELRLKMVQIALWGRHYDRALEQAQALIVEGNDRRPAVLRAFVDAAASAPKLGDATREAADVVYDRVDQGGLDSPRTSKSDGVASLARFAWVLQRLGQPERSASMLARAHALEPADKQLSLRYAQALMATSRWKEASRLFDSADPDPAVRRLLLDYYLKGQDFAAAEQECRRLLEAKPGDPPLLRLFADVLSWKGDYAESIVQFDRLIAAQPNDPTLPVRAAEVALWSRDYADAFRRCTLILDRSFDQPAVWRIYVSAAAAVAVLSEGQGRLVVRIADALDSRPAERDAWVKDSPMVVARLGWVLNRLKRQPRAAALLARISTYRPEAPPERRELAGILAAIGSPRQALDLLTGLPEDRANRIVIAGLYASLKDYGTADKMARTLVAEQPDDLKAVRLLADVLSWEGKRAEALRLYARLRAQLPDDKELPVRVAEVTLWDRQFDAALAQLTALLTPDFDRPGLWRPFVDAASSATTVTPQQGELALKITERVERNAASAEPVERPEALFLARLAWVLRRGGHGKKGIGLLTLIKDAYPADPQARRELAGAYAAVGMAREALALYRGLTLTDEDRFTLVGLYAAAHEYAPAEKEARQILVEQPASPRAQRLLANVLSWKGDYAEALTRLRRLAMEAPTDETLPIRIAEVTLWSGRHEEALGQLEAILDKNFDRPAAWAPFVAAAAASKDWNEAQTRLAQRIADQVDPAAVEDAAFAARLAWVMQRLDAGGEKGAARRKALLDRAVALAPQDAATRRELAGILAAVGQNKEAIAIFETLMLDRAERFQLAGLYAAEKEFAKAVPLARALFEERADYRARRLFADVLSWQGEHKEALRLLKALQAEQPADPEIPVRIAEVTLWSHDYDEALKLYSALFTDVGEQTRLWPGFIDAASSAATLGDVPARQARTLAVLLTQRPKKQLEAVELSRLAWVMLKIKSTEKAKALLELAVARDPRAPTARRELAGVLAAAGDYAQAIRFLKRLEHSLQDHLFLATAYAGLKDFDAARQECAAAARERPDDPEVRFRVAQVTLWSKDYDRALTELSDLVRTRPESPELWAAFIDAAASAKAAPESNLKMVRALTPKLLTSRATQAATLARLGWVLQRYGETEEAVKVLRKAVARDPESRESRLQLAQALNKVGAYDEADVQYRILLEQGRLKER